MSSDSMLVFKEASATEMAQAFRQRVPVVKEFIPDVAADIKATVAIGRVSLVRRATLRSSAWRSAARNWRIC